MTVEQELNSSDTDPKANFEKKLLVGTDDGVSSLSINLTDVNSTFNFTTTQEVRIIYNKKMYYKSAMPQR